VNRETPPASEAVKTAIERAYRRNAAVMITWDAVWSLGMSFCLFTTQAPAYLLTLGAPKWLMQSAMVTFSLMVALQFFSGRLAHLPGRRWLVFGTWFGYGAVWFAYALVAHLGRQHLGASVLTGLFLCMVGALAVCNHLGVPVTMGIVLENTPLRRRGRLASARSFVVGVFGLVGAQGARRVMMHWAEPDNFHVAFLIGGGLFMLSCLPFLFAFRDHAQANYAREPRETSIRRSVAMLWSHFGFRVFLFFYALMVACQSLAPMLIAYSRDRLRFDASALARFPQMWFVAALVTGPLILRLADRYGFRLIAIIGAALLAAAFLLPLGGAQRPWMMLAAYACYAASAQMGFLVLGNLGAELVPKANPAFIIAFGFAAVMPLALVLAPLTGLLVDVRGAEAYLAIFVLGSATALMALLGFTMVVREPRRGRLIYVRVRRG